MKSKPTNTEAMPGGWAGFVVLMVTLSAGWVVLMTISQLGRSLTGILPH